MESCLRITHFVVAAAILSGMVTHASAECPSRPTAKRFEFLANGAEVRDVRTGLVWARCAVGQAWSGSACTGLVSNFSHEAALIYTATQSGWRLPNRRELSNLADKGCFSPSIDTSAFPSTPSLSFWTSTPNVADSNRAWLVSFESGGVFSNNRSAIGPVRLVRVAQ